MLPSDFLENNLGSRLRSVTRQTLIIIDPAEKYEAYVCILFYTLMKNRAVNSTLIQSTLVAKVYASKHKTLGVLLLCRTDGAALPERPHSMPQSTPR